MPWTVTDGSSPRDAPSRVTIDTADPASRWRYSCPHGHTTLDPTNGGVWCQSCANNHDIEDPHHHAILDKRTGERVPWSAVDYR